MIIRIQTLTLLSALCGARAACSSEVEVDPPLPEPIEIGAAIGGPDLAPYFTTPSLKSALSELQAGRAANALRYPPSRPDDVPTRWLKAMALKAAEQPERARPLFQQIAQKGGPLKDRALYMAALCAVDEGNAKVAEKLLGQ